MHTNKSNFLHFHAVFNKSYAKQECIPVGCVPATRRPYARVCFLGGVWSGGGCVWSGGCLVWGGGVSGPGGGGWCVWSGGGGVPGLGGVCLVGGVWSGGLVCLVQGRGVVCLVWGWCVWSRGVCAWSGGSASVPCGIPPPRPCTPPVNRMTNKCKNITLATTSLRPVIIG